MYKCTSYIVYPYPNSCLEVTHKSYSKPYKSEITQIRSSYTLTYPIW